MPTPERQATFNRKLELDFYLSSFRDLIEKLNSIKEKQANHEKIELNHTQAIEAQQNKQRIQNASGTPLISKIVDGLIFVLLQLEISIKETREYIKQYEINDEIISKKIKDEIEEIINIQHRMLQSSLKDYYEMQKKKEELQKEMERLIIKISIINKRLNEIQKEQHRIVANMITNIDKLVEISLDINGEQKTVSFSMNEVRNELLQDAPINESNYLRSTPESILSNAMLKIALAHFSTTHNIASESALIMATNICHNLSIDIIEADPNKITNSTHFNALENEKIHYAEEIIALNSRLNHLHDENSHILSSMNQLELILDKESEKINTCFRHIESDLYHNTQSHSLENEEKEKASNDDENKLTLNKDIEIDGKLKTQDIKNDETSVVVSNLNSSEIKNTQFNATETKENKEDAHNEETKAQTQKRKRIKTIDLLKTAQESSEEKAQGNKEVKSPGLLSTTGLFSSRSPHHATVDKTQSHNNEKNSNDTIALPDKDTSTHQATPRR